MASANEKFDHHIGSEQVYREMMFRTFLYTEGILDLSETMKCYWLLTEIFIGNVFNNKIKAEGFQVWDLTRIKDSKFELKCEDGNDKLIFKKTISPCDFEDDELKLFFVDNTLLLPSEY